MDELVKDLRESAPRALAEADFDFVEGWLKEAADAIEELQKRVPKTPHGRLIDADELANSITGAIYHSDLRDAPTIIPAEEGE